MTISPLWTVVCLVATLKPACGQQIGINPNPGSILPGIGGGQLPNINLPLSGQFPQTNFPTIGSQFPASSQSLTPSSSVAFMMIRGMRNPTAQVQAQQQGSYIAYRQEITKLNAITNPNYGAFTVSIPGIYFFTFTAQASASSPFRVILRLNNNVIASLFAAQNQMMSQSAVVAATTGQIVYPILAGDISDSSFAGFLVTPIYMYAVNNVAAPNSGNLQPPTTNVFPNSPFAAGLRLKMNSTGVYEKVNKTSTWDESQPTKHENEL